MQIDSRALRSRWLPLVLAPWFALGCASPLEEIAPFHSSSLETFRRDVRAICLEPAVTGFPVAGWASRAVALERLLELKLSDAGLEVVGPVEVARATEAFDAAQAGGYDRHSGGIDRASQRAAEQALADFLFEALGCEARLRADVELVLARWQAGTATWDARQHFNDGWQGYGVVNALSLWLRIFDRTGAEVYFRSSGIQLVFEQPGSLFARIRRVPDADLLEAGLLARAVVWALEPLAPPHATCRGEMGDWFDIDAGRELATCELERLDGSADVDARLAARTGIAAARPALGYAARWPSASATEPYWTQEETCGPPASPIACAMAPADLTKRR